MGSRARRRDGGVPAVAGRCVSVGMESLRAAISTVLPETGGGRKECPAACLPCEVCLVLLIALCVL